MNPLLKVDSYKLGHYLQYPPNINRISSYIEPRTDEQVVFFGLQAFLKEHMSQAITTENIKEAAGLYTAHGVPFNEPGFTRIVNKHGGHWPVLIDAVPEGLVMPGRNMQVQIVNTDEELPWVTSFLETALHRAVWYPSTVATISRRAKEIIYWGLQYTSDSPDEEIMFKLHDFGARGVSSSESAQLGGMAHLVNFMGTDTVEGVYAAMRYYGGEMPGFSIPATEHSTITAWGRKNEVAAYRNLLEQHPDGLIACVSDSYDIWNATDNIWGDELRDMVLARNGTLVVRPDSGDPVVVPLDVIERLMDKFGHTVNSKGFKVLPSCVRVIQGDGMNLESIQALTHGAMRRGLSTENFAMGMGGGLLQKLDRDTLSYAMKASAKHGENGWEDVYKDPVTDHGKRSKRGCLATVQDDAGIHTVRIGEVTALQTYVSKPVWMNGELLSDQSFESVRACAALL